MSNLYHFLVEFIGGGRVIWIDDDGIVVWDFFGGVMLEEGGVVIS